MTRSGKMRGSRDSSLSRQLSWSVSNLLKAPLTDKYLFLDPTIQLYLSADPHGGLQLPKGRHSAGRARHHGGRPICPRRLRTAAMDTWLPQAVAAEHFQRDLFRRFAGSCRIGDLCIDPGHEGFLQVDAPDAFYLWQSHWLKHGTSATFVRQTALTIQPT